MNRPNPYPPDRSLLLAVLILTGGLLLTAGGIYLLAMLSEGVSLEYQTRMARVRD